MRYINYKQYSQSEIIKISIISYFFIILLCNSVANQPYHFVKNQQVISNIKYQYIKQTPSIMTQMVAQKSKRISRKGPGRQTRLWVRAKFLGFRRSKVQQNVNQSILRLEGVNDRSAAQYYFGKRVVYIFKTTSGQKSKRFRTIWGRISRSHGNTGAVVARFSSNLPPRAIGSTLRVMLFPQRA